MHGISNEWDQRLAFGVRIAYVAGIVLSIFAFFSGVVVKFPPIDYGIAGLLALAVVVHEYLVQRRVNAAFSRFRKWKTERAERKAMVSNFASHLSIMVGLTAFDIFNVVQYTGLSTSGHGLVGTDTVALVRGICIPLFFFLSSFLEPVDEDASSLLARVTSQMTFKTTKVMLRQWDSRLDEAEKQNVDMTPMAQTLLEDEGDVTNARRIGVMASGLRTTEERGTLKRNDSKGVKVRELYSSQTQAASGAKPSRLTPSFDMQIDSRSDDEKVHFKPSKRLPRRVIKLTPRDKILRFLDKNPEASNAEVCRALKVSNNTVKKYRPEWEMKVAQAI